MSMRLVPEERREPREARVATVLGEPEIRSVLRGALLAPVEGAGLSAAQRAALVALRERAQQGADASPEALTPRRLRRLLAEEHGRRVAELLMELADRPLEERSAATRRAQVAKARVAALLEGAAPATLPEGAAAAP